MNKHLIQKCAVTELPIKAGDQIIQVEGNTYALKAHIKLTAEERVALEKKLFETPAESEATKTTPKKV